MPSRLGLIMDMTARQLERVIYYEDYLVVDPGKAPLPPPPAFERDRISRSAGTVRRNLHRQDGRGSDPSRAPGHRPRQHGEGPDRSARQHEVQADPQESGQAPQACAGLYLLEDASGMDDPRSAAGDSARPASARAAGRWPLCDVRSERSLPPRHQPQQPSPQFAPAQDARRHHPQ